MSRKSFKKVKNENDQLTEMVSKLSLEEDLGLEAGPNQQLTGRSSSDI